VAEQIVRGRVLKRGKASPKSMPMISSAPRPILDPAAGQTDPWKRPRSLQPPVPELISVPTHCMPKDKPEEKKPRTNPLVTAVAAPAKKGCGQKPRPGEPKAKVAAKDGQGRKRRPVAEKVKKALSRKLRVRKKKKWKKPAVEKPAEVKTPETRAGRG